MAASPRDRLPMLAPGRYPQWRSRFLRYVDTRPNGEALRKCILSGPYKPTTVLVQVIDATDDSPAVPEHTTVKTPISMSPENKAHFLAEKEAIHLILTGIGDDIYSTVDASQTAQEMWEAIERLQQSESLNIQYVMTNLFWNNLTVTTMQVNVQFLQQLQPEWSRFVTIVKQQHKLDEVSYHKLFDILKQYQNEVNELRAKRLAKNANPLALVATDQANRDQYYQTSRSHRSSAPSPKPSIPSRSHTTTKHKGKEIAKPITPPFETSSKEDSDPEQAQRDKDMKKNLALIAKYFKKIYKPTNNNLRTSSNSKNKNVDTTSRGNVGSKVVQQSGIQCFNCKEYGHFAKECRMPKRVKDSAYHKEKMLLCKQAEQGVLLQAEQYDWLVDTYEEVDEQELEAHYNYMAKIQEVPIADSGTDSEPVEPVQNDAGYNVFANHLQHSEQSKFVSNTCLVETDDTNVIPNSPDMREDDIQNEQNDVESDDERVTLANLIANLKLDVDENKKIQKQLKKANTILAQELKECKAILIETKMHADLKYVETLEKEIDEFKYDKAEFSYMYDVILQECVSKDVMCSYLQSLSDLDALTELQCMYLHRVKECDCLAQKLSKQTEFVSKKVHTELLQRFAKVEKLLISLEIALQKCKEQVKNDTVCNEKASNLFRKERKQYFKIQDLKAQLQDKNIAIRVNHNTNVSRPQLKSNQSRNKVLPNNSQVKAKKTQVEVHPRIPSVSNKMKSVTARKDSLNPITLNENAVCATCNKCLVDSNHFACVTKLLNNVHARTKKPNVVPISTRKPKSQVNKSVATPNRKKVASKSTNQKPQSYIRVLYENTNKAWKWWIERQSLPGYKWVPKPKKKSTCFVRDLQDDYSRYTWTLFLRSKDETPEVLKEFLMMIQRNLQALVITVRTDRGTEFLNKTLNAFFKEEGIEHQTFTARTPEQNGVVERRNRTLVEASRTMLSASQLPLLFWAEASDYDNPDTVPQRQDDSSSVDEHVPSQQELDLLFGPLYDEFFNAGSNPQDKQPSTNIPSTSAPSTYTNVHAKENNNDQAE
nr:putative ribonuclease H-like domain-containing protein [Tanacetum cinerariifolium]